MTTRHQSYFRARPNGLPIIFPTLLVPTATMDTSSADYNAVPLQEPSLDDKPSTRELVSTTSRSTTPKRKGCSTTTATFLFVLVLVAGLMVAHVVRTNVYDKGISLATAISYLRPGETAPEWNPSPETSHTKPAAANYYDSDDAMISTSATNQHAVVWNDNKMDAFTMPQSEWRRWLDDHPVLEGQHLRKGTFWRTGCGISMILKFGTSDSDNNHNTPTAFLKYSIAKDKKHYTAEYHHREIMSGYLDRVLGTQVAPPAVGHRFAYAELETSVSTQDEQHVLARSTQCGRTSAEYLDASVMLFLNNVTLSRIDVVEEAARSFDINNNNNNNNNELGQSAIHYAVFHYLAGCMKSTHNHFVYQQKRFIAIDNDRCFTPEAVMNAKHVPAKDYEQFHVWVTILYNTCQFPLPIVEMLEHATNNDNNENDNRLLSRQLQVALQEDPMADQLLKLQPETFDEMDRRAETLMEHIRSCQGRFRE
jgi:hypothetical protein